MSFRLKIGVVPMSKLIFSLSLFLLYSVAYTKVEVLKTTTMADIKKKAEEYGQKYKPQNVLVVFDTDNTLLAANQELGSDQWFSWQEDMIFGNKKESEKTNLVSPTMNGLLHIQGLFFTLSKMTPPESISPQIVSELQNNGYKTIVLTSRGPEFLFSTLRELYRNGYSFKSHSIGGGQLHLGNQFPAYDPSVITKNLSIIPSDFPKYKIKEKAPHVIYSEGVYFTAGAHKGLMMRLLLEETKYQPKAIVFADDKVRHVERMADAFAKTQISVSSYLYQKEDAKVEAFNKSDKKNVIKQWNDLLESMNKKPSEFAKISTEIFI